MRRIAMLQMIPTWPKTMTTSEFHEKLKLAGYMVEPRTVQRDLLEFSQTFHYLSECRGRSIHWYWANDRAAISIRSISPEAALVLNLAERELQGLLPSAALKLLEPYFQQAREALDSNGATRLASWKDKLQVIPRGPQFEKPRVDAAAQSSIFEALLCDQKIRVFYRGRGQDRAKESVLNPLGIVSRHGVIYLVATAWSYSDPFHYALHRFTRVELMDERCSRPEGFNLDRYLKETRAFDLPTGQGRIRLKLDVAAEAALSLIERPLSAEQSVRELQSGEFRIEAQVEDTMELRWWILGLGSNVKVIGPASLRREILGCLEAARNRYLPSVKD